MAHGELSIQVNYTHKSGGLMTACAGIYDALDLARVLHEEGHRVGSVAAYLYRRGARRPTLVAIWYASAARAYYGEVAA